MVILLMVITVFVLIKVVPVRGFNLSFEKELLYNVTIVLALFVIYVVIGRFSLDGFGVKIIM